MTFGRENFKLCYVLLRCLFHLYFGVFNAVVKPLVGFAVRFGLSRSSKYIKTTGEYNGSVLEYYINGVPKKKNEYDTAIAKIIDEEKFKLLINPKYFIEILDWKTRRAILFYLAETKSDSELAAESSDFAEIQTELETMGNAFELLKAVSAQVKKNSERINVLPKLINENTTKLSQVSAISESDRCSQ